MHKSLVLMYEYFSCRNTFWDSLLQRRSYSQGCTIHEKFFISVLFLIVQMSIGTLTITCVSWWLGSSMEPAIIDIGMQICKQTCEQFWMFMLIYIDVEAGSGWPLTLLALLFATHFLGHDEDWPLQLRQRNVLFTQQHQCMYDWLLKKPTNRQSGSFCWILSNDTFFVSSLSGSRIPSKMALRMQEVLPLHCCSCICMCVHTGDLMWVLLWYHFRDNKLCVDLVMSVKSRGVQQAVLTLVCISVCTWYRHK